MTSAEQSRTNISDIEYSQLTPNDRLASVRARIRDLEVAYQQLSLRINMPSPSDIITQNDKDNAKTLEESLSKLHTLESQLSS